MLKKIITCFLDLKQYVAKYKINNFFTNIEDIVSKYLKIYIMKPNALVESNDLGFKSLELYNLKNSILNEMSFDQRLNFYSRIKSKHINVNNCLYYSYNEKGKQPLIFTIWSLGEEIRVGCFIDQSIPEEVFKKQKEKVERLFKLFQTPLFEIRQNEIDRNDYYLTEVILTNKTHQSIYDSYSNQIFLAQLFAVVITQNMLEYIELTGKK